MKAIGGYFELELNHGKHYHENAIRLNTARNCFKYILITKKYKKVYLPYYTCSVMLETVKNLNIKCEFYFIDEHLDPIFSKKIENNEVFVYTNYFGLKKKTIEQLSQKWQNLIIDNSQAFYDRPISHVDTFYSARKFFGVSDGGYLYTDCLSNKIFKKDFSFNRMMHLLKRIDLGAEHAFHNFHSAEQSLDNAQILYMSELTERLLSSIDYHSTKIARQINYNILASALNEKNNLKLEDICKEEVPMVYPYLSNNLSLKEKLIKNKIFVATYWPNVLNWCPKNSFEHILSNVLLPLPIDQRYNEKDMYRILKFLG